jgi:hypothetical protein
MDILDVILEFKAAQKAIIKQGANTTVGDSDTVDIPEAEELAALLVKGKNGARFRIDGIRYTREK